MLEVIVDRWSKGGKTDYLWSVWRDGKRIHQGDARESGDAAEAAARRYCQRELGQAPDKVTRL